MSQNKESSNKFQNSASSERESAKTISQNGNAGPDRAEYKQNPEKHKQFQDWINTIYSLLKKILVITFGNYIEYLKQLREIAEKPRL